MMIHLIFIFSSVLISAHINHTVCEEICTAYTKQHAICIILIPCIMEIKTQNYENIMVYKNLYRFIYINS